MKRFRRNERGRASRGGESLVRLATAAASSGGMLEDAFWAKRLNQAVRPLLTGSGQASIESALDRLSNTNARAYDLLADAVEGCVESGVLVKNGDPWDCLMFAVPILAWSRTRIPSGPLREADANALIAQLCGHVFARDVQVTLLARLLTPDQLPNSYAEEAAIARMLFKAVQEGAVFVKGERPADALDFVSDTRYVIGAVAAPQGNALFAAQEDESLLESSQQAWLTQGRGAFASLLAGAQIELLMPGAFYSTLRRADREGRTFYVTSGAAYVSAMLATPTERITAAFAPFYDDHGIAEYRIGLSVGRSDDVHHGITWPVLGETEVDDASTQIREALAKAGV
ncbi:MAG TPA: DUF2863 family protein, partial [Burkholderiaceae bacterium]|nr:DUF2863 family protein [Burkholderiaceae bacterium]